jgi:homoserine O-acetyltransferase/O-succinyltransferase
VGRVGADPTFGGALAAALGAIRGPATIMPGRTDLYFPPEDSAPEVRDLPRGELRTIPSDWGHYAGGGRDRADVAFIDAALRELLAENGDRAGADDEGRA